ncbi:MAG: hypothetical protein M0018_12000 [Nitrospiraceae bacterium]|nr:hypothetical protein [Nitrospiraceae bacterium]
MLSLDFSFMMSEAIGEKGIPQRKMEGIRAKALAALADLKARKFGGAGWLDLPSQSTSDIKNAAKKVVGLENFILLGIGGSALGPKCILEALSPFHNVRMDKYPKVFIYDNVDPSTLDSILHIAELTKTAVNVISKSGGTAETAASFMILFDRLQKSLNGDRDAGSAESRFILTTDPEKGDLRKLAGARDMPSLPVPPDVGGRYSVLSPVGLLLAEVIGVDCDQLLKGAMDIREKCLGEEFTANPALVFASLIYLMGKEEGKGINVLMPYSDRLRAFSEWFCQLWAESLGKDGTGFTPYPSAGTTDQHSQLQLWMDGPQDKVVIFLRVADYQADYTIPDVFGDFPGMSYLRGHTLSGLIKAEEEASELALAKAGRPSISLKIPKVDAYHLGQLFYFFEAVTAFTGYMLGINPFDQPSVELGKQLTFGLMGRKGFEEKAREAAEARSKRTGFIAS